MITITRSPILQAVMEAMERISPCRYADHSWDNVGLLFESPVISTPPSPKVMLCNDLTLPVLHEAIRRSASIIISYHPPWFKAEKSMRVDGPLSLIAMAGAAHISIYSPHTALDAVAGGLNDWLLECFGEMQASKRAIVPCTDGDDAIGYGRMAQLHEEITVEEAVGLVKRHLGLKHVRVAGDLKKRVRSVAVCAGSGGSIVSKLASDLVVTGELSHHQVLALVAAGSAVILTEHSNSERKYIQSVLCAKLCSELPQSIQVMVSEEDVEPLSVI